MKTLDRKPEENKDKEKDEEVEETLDEILERAVSEEGDAIDTYVTMLEKADNDDLKSMIEEIKSDEEEHKKLLEYYIETGKALTDEELEEVEKEKKTENKKLTESHLDDYSSEKGYKVSYITTEGTERQMMYKPTKNTNIAGVQKELSEQNKDFFKLKDIKEVKQENKKVMEGKKMEDEKKLTISERLLQEIIQSVSSEYTLDNVVCETSPEGNVHIKTRDGKDICTVGREQFTISGDDTILIDELRENGYWDDLDALDEEDLIEKDTLTEATDLSVRDENKVIVNKNQYGYTTIGIIIDDENKRFQLVSGQTLPTGKYKKAPKKAIRQKAEDLKAMGYEEVRGNNSLAESKEVKTEAVTTQKGTFEKGELDAMEQEMKDAFNDYWNDKISVQDLEAVKAKLGKYLTNAQITNCQLEASQKKTEGKSPLFRFKNGEINRGEFDEIADKESPEYKYMNHEINWEEYDKLADHNSADYKYLNNEINFSEYAKLNENTIFGTETAEEKAAKADAKSKGLYTEAFSDSEERDFVRYGNCIAVQDYADNDVVGYIFYENEEDYKGGITSDYMEFTKPFEKDVIIDHMKEIFGAGDEEIYYLQDKILDYEKKGIGSKEEYENNLDRLHQLQSMDESKVTEDIYEDDLSNEGIITEYTITFDDMSMDDEIFGNREEADARFEELKASGDIDKVHQYFKKKWVWNEGTQEYEEDFVDVYYTQGDLIEESEKELIEQDDFDEYGFPKLEKPYYISYYEDKDLAQISSSHPYDLTDYSYAQAKLSDSLEDEMEWKIYDDGKLVQTTDNIYEVVRIMKEIDSKKKPNIDRT